MIVRHVGIRPIHKTVMYNKYLPAIRGYCYEMMPEGGHKVWTDRMLKSGCNYLIVVEETIGDLIYCKYCGEFFSKNQFEEQ